MKILKVLELFSGIGGLHYGINESGIRADVKIACDINSVANDTYAKNFPDVKLYRRNAQVLNANYLNSQEIDAVFMSPPCQPFTRNGLQQDVNDGRTIALLHVINLIKDLKHLKYMFVENVKGFEVSEARARLLSALEYADFIYQEFILSPHQIGVPNTRHRYFLLARKKNDPFKFQTSPEVMTSIPAEEEFPAPFPLSRIIESGSHIDFREYYLSDRELVKFVHLVDIACSDSNRSCCFTKSYTRFIEGTGSVYTNLTKQQANYITSQLCQLTRGTVDYEITARQLQLRFFTPKEVARLMCFPETFSFDKNATRSQKYKLLGNSVNVRVVALLFQLLVEDTYYVRPKAEDSD